MAPTRPLLDVTDVDLRIIHAGHGALNGREQP
jgi:hypothetical protein